MVLLPVLPAAHALDQGLALNFANSVGRLLAHPDGYALLRFHSGPRTLDHLKAFLAHTSQLLRRRGWQGLLVDQRGMQAFTVAEQAWIVDYWLARQQAEGRTLCWAALVGADELVCQPFRSQRFTSEGAGLTYRCFLNEGQAATWLRPLREPSLVGV
jgi:hypothetical protein